MSPALGPELRTARLRLRRWRHSDLVPFAELNADPVVMEYFPATLSRAESNALADRIEREFDERGYGLWAVELEDSAQFIGFAGLTDVRIDVPFAPAVEVGWRLGRDHWGRGYATEAARSALRFAFGDLGIDEIVSITAAQNVRSRRVMERLRLERDRAADFEHPSIPTGHRLRHHVLYRARRNTWLDDQQQDAADSRVEAPPRASAAPPLRHNTQA